MLRAPAILTLLAAAASLPAGSRAEHSRISLDVAAGTVRETANVDQTPPDWGKNPRPVVRAKLGEPVKIQYVLTNVDPRKSLENVVVHAYVARQAKVGARETPDLNVEANVALETAFEMDFRPGAKAGARATVRVDRPGVYLVRVETRQTGSDHEHFAAVDLVVE